MYALNGTRAPDDSLELLMQLMFDGMLDEEDARRLILLVGSLGLDVSLAARPSELRILVE